MFHIQHNSITYSLWKYRWHLLTPLIFYAFHHFFFIIHRITLRQKGILLVSPFGSRTIAHPTKWNAEKLTWSSWRRDLRFKGTDSLITTTNFFFVLIRLIHVHNLESKSIIKKFCYLSDRLPFYFISIWRDPSTSRR